MSQITQLPGGGPIVYHTTKDDDGLPSVRYFGDPTTERRLLDRTSFGFTRYELSQLIALGQEGYLRAQLWEPQGIDDSTLDAYLGATFPSLTMTAAQLASASDPSGDLIRARLMRAIFSRRQLFERVIECWSDHFNIWIRADLPRFLKTRDDNDVLRMFGLTTFPELLSASAHSPAMLTFLNNDTNKVGVPNENYARELMELHTLSVNGGYTQDDVTNVAKCFTGWTYVTTAGATQYTFQFKSTSHEPGAKTVLGNIIPARTGNSAMQDGDDVITILANHPSTMNFVAYKLCRHFHSHEPPQGLVNSVAQIYASTGGDIRSMLDFVLRQAILPGAPLKFKRPMHLLASTLRALSARVTATNNLQTPLAAAGHTPFDWAAPNGYPDSIAAWAGLLLPRWNFGASLTSTSNTNNGDWYNAAAGTGVRVVASDVIGTAVTSNAVLDAVNAAVFNNTMPFNERTTLRTYLLPDNPTASKVRDALGMAVAMPSFQWY